VVYRHPSAGQQLLWFTLCVCVSVSVCERARTHGYDAEPKPYQFSLAVWLVIGVLGRSSDYSSATGVIVHA